MTAQALAVALLLTPLAPSLPPALAAPAQSPGSTDSTGSAAGQAVAPLSPPRLVAAFDPPADAYGAGHRGVDLAGSPGELVRSALAGTVTTAGWIGGMPVVVVTHGDLRTTYQPVVATVGVGAAVAAGDALGELVPASSHCAPDACLHWGLKRGEEYLDPMSLLGPQRVRLLPVPSARP